MRPESEMLDDLSALHSELIDEVAKGWDYWCALESDHETKRDRLADAHDELTEDTVYTRGEWCRRVAGLLRSLQVPWRTGLIPDFVAKTRQILKPIEEYGPGPSAKRKVEELVRRLEALSAESVSRQSEG